MRPGYHAATGGALKKTRPRQLLCLLWFLATSCTDSRGAAPLPQPSVGIFVAGIEGAGHHGAVLGFLAPILEAALAPPNETARVAVFEMPPHHALSSSDDDDKNEKRASLDACPRSAVIGWESFPAQHRVSPKSRLSLLYESRACFARGKQKRATNTSSGEVKEWPGSWRAAGNVSDAPACLRCDGVVPTYEAVVQRLDRSDRLALVPFQAEFRVKVVFLMRAFDAAVASHSIWDGGAVGHAVMMAAHLTLLARDAEAMPKHAWRVLWYETLEHPDGYVNAAIEAVRFLTNLKDDDDDLAVPTTRRRRRETTERALEDAVNAGGVASCVLPARADEVARDARRNKWRPPSVAHHVIATTQTPERQIVHALGEAVAANWSIFSDPAQQLVPLHVAAPAPPQASSPKVALHDDATLHALLYGTETTSLEESRPRCSPMDVQVCDRKRSEAPIYPPHTERLCTPKPDGPR